MQYRKLGHTGLDVSIITLGTMTWGQQNTEAEAHSQIDLALEAGINLIDTAEMYPVPPMPETQGRTEEYIGAWLAKGGRRDKALIATKAAGPSRQKHNPGFIRGGKAQHDRQNLTEALHASLRRLRTDYVDLYQLHWPDRTTNTFGMLSYPWVDDEYTVPIRETLEVLADFVKQGLVRHVGVSNETPWGVAQFLQLAKEHDLPRIASIQNPYSLLNRSYEIGLAEFSHRDGLALLGYSPLGFGVLSGKYLDGARPAGARLTLFDRFVRYTNPHAQAATAEYVALAHKHGLDPSQMATAFALSRRFMTSSIIGATTLEQLRSNIASVDVTLGDEVIAGINAIHARWSNPVQ
ncbi:NADP(H)-dependent aldo-keto reductase [Uliginosibacterium sp. H1]|uniref:NADP(H)-dependent aldo-keto reductase n=1 Tax=Uliginosibacterium sp. H1 TaxID=3114757 RepID=UPI002E19776E|nr:NADP(H)-dependent aldo-keto reductase [Uliginosibacterium sp. H1]